MTKTIEKCLLTNGTETVILNTHDCSADDLYHTGIDISCYEVYSICQGIVIQLSKDSDNTYAVTVQNNSDECVRYMRLSQVNVKQGALVNIGDLVGIADKFVHFEYITSNMSEPVLPVRINSITYYKQNPIDLLEGSKTLSASIFANDSKSYDSMLTEAQLSEFSHGGPPDTEFDGSL